ncbi:zinc finger protein 567-like isoform X1 [Centruroides sculpturatus]|uniref:zinc finger protein 567-like isoform X1 n=1 Tax=Centruroides sculpturatus TaxID=218467 RepID=UPI000C6CC086|nr:zinc finger protein 567-like isoform X1 [Centruroides sculpturatus]XP_023241075.1 zinc finger protein 567-like isoform X1 [Centruroides sculpturatus]
MESEFQEITHSSNIWNNFPGDNSIDCDKEEINKNYDIKHVIKSECRVVLKKLNITVKTGNYEIYLPEENVLLKVMRKNSSIIPQERFNRNGMKIQINKDEQNEKHVIHHNRKRPKYYQFKSNRKRSISSITKINKIRSSIKNKYLNVMWASHPKEYFTCNLCLKTFANYKVLRTHLFFHIGNKRFHCSTCHQMFPWIFLLRRHMREHAYEKHIEDDNTIVRMKSCSKYLLDPLIPWNSFHCDICDKSVLTISRVKMRDRTHLSHICKLCKKEFKWESHLKIHLATHSEDRPYKCDICNKCFKSRPSLTNHKTIHNDERNHFCLICKRSFKTQGALKNHSEIHNVEYKYTCSICNKRFKTKNCLSAHKSTHRRN